MKINPVYQKEIKTSVRGIKTAVILMGFNGLLALFGLFAFYITFEYETKFGQKVDYSEILQIYAIVTAVEFTLVLFAVPALTASSISGERERQTLEILLTTNISPLKIILGKLGSSISMIILLVVSSMPIIALVFSIGGITLYDLFQILILIVITAVFVGSIGVFFSAFFKKTTTATVCTYGALVFLIGGSILLLWVITMVMDLGLNKLATESAVHINPDIGNGILVLLVNPAITCFSMIENQIGTGTRLTSFFQNFGSISIRIQNQWFLISVAVQLGISMVLIWCSSLLLNPIKQNHLSKRMRVS